MSRFNALYLIQADNMKNAKAKAFDICVEQTIEFPYELVQDKKIRQQIVGRTESLKKSRAGYLARIFYADITAGSELTQFLNVLFGNTSIKPGVRLLDFNLPRALRARLKGPAFGVKGLRLLTRTVNRPLVCSALKPMGTSPAELAGLATAFTLGGVDLIKDDHGLANQTFSPFKQRVTAVCKAVSKANSQCKGHTLYAPNITADGSEYLERALFAQKAGAGAVVISPGLSGFTSITRLRQEKTFKLPIVMHPAFLGSFTANPVSGLAHSALYGRLARLLGADVSIFPNYGGRFSFTKDECRGIANACADPFEGYRSILPGPGGGTTLPRLKELKKFYGNDVIFLIGGGLFGDDDIVSACRQFKDLVS